ncbi:YecA family protein [Pontibacillus litoralis]|uniref:SEC-C motif-containing protein n=1 Tax=Pontibacillus litoralis JSM 072002 TaxID=1385512 RepID=A0A0A5G5A2_9BACI|nr:SEC-C metal-binding domain-containing protein [Pontibacillus litoralis]KGX86333.1 hypothetical protein N784_05125 [Pontibacillus litoralis JSM 072002]
MVEPGRNEPCPCGSGKKYKKCCKNVKVTSFPKELVDEELHYLLNQLNEFTHRHYGFHIPRVPVKTDQKLYNLMSVLHTSLFSPLQDGTRIVDTFIKQRINDVKRPATKESFQQWTDVQIGIFHVEEKMDSVTLKMKNLFTDATTTIYMENSQDTPYFVGIVGAWGQHHRFLPFSFPMTESTFKRYKDPLDQEYAVNSNGRSLHQYFQDTFLHQLLRIADIMKHPIKEDFMDKWEGKPEQHEVMELFEQQVDMEIFSQEEVDHIKQFWMVYCDNQQPNIRKPEVFAATLEYFFGTDPLFGEPRNVTQKGLGAKYGVSANTISKRSSNMSTIFHDMFQKGRAQ